MHLKCERCGWKGQPNLSYAGDQNQHIKATCPECDSYIKFCAQDNLDHGDYAILNKDAIEEEDGRVATFNCPSCGTSLYVKEEGSC